ncbi:hypothetical protein C8R44DRAFT_742872 [Mycena epipterygia]|nr:hypothetical protein C8R44DRAFT_742872 [Mycena epipterygia]
MFPMSHGLAVALLLASSAAAQVTRVPQCALKCGIADTIKAANEAHAAPPESFAQLNLGASSITYAASVHNSRHDIIFKAAPPMPGIRIHNCSDFALGEICVNYNTGAPDLQRKVCVRRVYSARFNDTSVTVAMYQGDDAEELSRVSVESAGLKNQWNSSGSMFDASGFFGDEFAGCIPRDKETPNYLQLHAHKMFSIYGWLVQCDILGKGEIIFKEKGSIIKHDSAYANDSAAGGKAMNNATGLRVKGTAGLLMNGGSDCDEKHDHELKGVRSDISTGFEATCLVRELHLDQSG